ncbi:hypothetical protein GCM10007350_02910 [Jeongeupia chitinilytica]|uniref:Uncharacterized protein n=1 Tax=Jeongeupia chitinilytica TaxID=1041641 RepID=A0ABQ3GXJ2_9NEIS|nr:hypothetical protein GCM10007350_02910 [Jeongeupia chitinilytica]
MRGFGRYKSAFGDIQPSAHTADFDFKPAQHRQNELDVRVLVRSATGTVTAQTQGKQAIHDSHHTPAA